MNRNLSKSIKVLGFTKTQKTDINKLYETLDREQRWQLELILHSIRRRDLQEIWTLETRIQRLEKELVKEKEKERKKDEEIVNYEPKGKQYYEVQDKQY